jgi:hypothetical protein
MRLLSFITACTLLFCCASCCRNHDYALNNPGVFIRGDSVNTTFADYYDEIKAIVSDDIREVEIPDSDYLLLYLSPNHDQTDFVFIGTNRRDTISFAYERDFTYSSSFCGLELSFVNIKTLKNADIHRVEFSKEWW